MIFAIVSLADIDIENRQFCFSYPSHDRRLTESIRSVGLIHPIVARARPSHHRYQIISGFRRVASCLELNMKEIQAMLFEADEFTDRQLLLLSLHQTVSSRGLNLIEVSLVLRRLKELGGLSEQELTDDILPLCRLQPHRTVLRGLEGMWTFPEATKAYIVNNEVSPGNAALFTEFPPQEQEDLLKLIEPLKLGTNRLKEFLTLMTEIRHREAVSLQEIIDDNMRLTLHDENIPVPQKTEAIRGFLKRKRYPKLAEMEHEIRKKTEAMKLPPGISFSLPPYLEGDQARFAFSIQSTDDLRPIIRKLMEITENSSLDDILKML